MKNKLKKYKIQTQHITSGSTTTFEEEVNEVFNFIKVMNYEYIETQYGVGTRGGGYRDTVYTCLILYKQEIEDD